MSRLPVVVHVSTFDQYLALMDKTVPVMVYAPKGGLTADVLNNHQDIDIYADGPWNNLYAASNKFVLASLGSGNNSVVGNDNDFMFFHAGDGDNYASMFGNDTAWVSLGHGANQVEMYNNVNANVSLGDGPNVVTGGYNQSLYVTAGSGGGGGGGISFSSFGNGSSFVGANGGDNHIYSTYDKYFTTVTGDGADEVNIVGDYGSHVYAYLNGGDDILHVEGNGTTVAYLGSGQDIANGGNGVDFLFGEAGDDILSGRGGDDLLFGGAGRNILDGGAGNDMLAIHVGDVAIGGEGNDSFVFAPQFGAQGVVQILDFNPGQDRLDLTHLGDVGRQDLYTMTDGTLLVHNDMGVDLHFGGSPVASLDVVVAGETLQALQADDGWGIKG